MKTTATLKKWNVDNKLDKDGCPDPRMTVVLEIPFQPHLASSLAQITTGDSLQFSLDKYQMDMDFPDTQEDVQGETAQEEEQLPLLLTEGDFEEVEEEDCGQDEAPLTEAAG